MIRGWQGVSQQQSVEPAPAALSQPNPPVASPGASVQDPIEPPAKKIKIRVGLLKINPRSTVPSVSASASDALGGSGVSAGPAAGAREFCRTFQMGANSVMGCSTIICAFQIPLVFSFISC